MKRTLFVTGLNGFIGASLLPRLLETTNWHVVGIDLSSHRIAPYLNHPRLEFCEGDMAQAQGWMDQAVARAHVVLPLAAIANPSLYVTQPLKVFELDFEQNLALVRMCVRHGKRLVFPSTSEVYGLCPDEAFDEDHSLLVTGPVHKQRWIYSCAKQMMDRVIYAFGFEKQLRYTLFRPFNFVGPLMDNPMNPVPGASRAVIQFIGQAMRGETIRLVDGGQQTRCFTWIGDALDALVTILENPGGCADGQIFNLGNPHNHHSMAEVARMVIEAVSSCPETEEKARQTRIVTVPAGQYFGEGYDDTRRRVPSVAKARQILGWEPRITLPEALYRIVQYHLPSC